MNSLKNKNLGSGGLWGNPTAEKRKDWKNEAKKERSHGVDLVETKAASRNAWMFLLG